MLRSHLVIGEITKPQGVRGELKLRPITCDPDRLIRVGVVVEPDGIEPTTSSMPLKRSTN